MGMRDGAPVLGVHGQKLLSMMAWSLTTEDRVELRQQFLAMDTENRGTIAHSQMKHLLEENFHVDSQEAEALFAGLDYDNDDQIAYSEFLAAALQGRVKVHEDALRKTFQRFDIDSNGTIAADDLRVVLGDDFDGETFEELIQEADKDKNGGIDYEEFLAYFHRDPEAVAEEAEANLSRRSEHTEKLGSVVDRLVASVASAESMSPTGSLTSPKPLSRRTTKRAATQPTPMAAEVARGDTATIEG